MDALNLANVAPGGYDKERWRGGRAVQGDGLLNRDPLTGVRGFESHPLRQFLSQGMPPRSRHESGIANVAYSLPRCLAREVHEHLESRCELRLMSRCEPRFDELIHLTQNSLDHRFEPTGAGHEVDPGCSGIGRVTAAEDQPSLL